MQVQNEMYTIAVVVVCVYTSRWLTPLRDLLGKVSAKFSEYFSLMKCVGEVALHEDPVSTRAHKYLRVDGITHFTVPNKCALPEIRTPRYKDILD